MRQYFATIAASTVLLGGLGVVNAGSASAVGWCDAIRVVEVRPAVFIDVPYDQNPGSTNCLLSQGASGPAVFVLQKALRECNGQGSLDVDGEFGPRTKAALENAQERRGTTPDGVYGRNTRDALKWPASGAGTGAGACVSYPS